MLQLVAKMLKFFVALLFIFEVPTKNYFDVKKVRRTRKLFSDLYLAKF